MNRYNSEAQIAKDAMAVQDASNLVGVLKSFHEASQWLLQANTPNLNEHPAMQLFACKVHSMTRMGLSSHVPFNLAWVACEELVRKGAVLDLSIDTLRALTKEHMRIHEDKLTWADAEGRRDEAAAHHDALVLWLEVERADYIYADLPPRAQREVCRVAPGGSS